MAADQLRLSYDLAEIQSAAAAFWAWAKPRSVLTFTGGLGAGKTTFVHALCDHLGVTDTVSSPTFALINEYGLPDGQRAARMLHMDWYRLRDADEAINAGMEDALESRDAICIVEWPEQAPELLLMEHIAVTITLGETPEARVLEAEVVAER